MQLIVDTWTLSPDLDLSATSEIDTPHWDVRTCSEEHYDQRLAKREGATWRSRGTNHSVLPNGYIRRQLGMRKETVLEVPTLEALQALLAQHPSLVVRYDESDERLHLRTWFDGAVIEHVSEPADSAIAEPTERNGPRPDAPNHDRAAQPPQSGGTA